MVEYVCVCTKDLYICIYIPVVSSAIYDKAGTLHCIIYVSVLKLGSKKERKSIYMYIYIYITERFRPEKTGKRKLAVTLTSPNIQTYMYI